MGLLIVIVLDGAAGAVLDPSAAAAGAAATGAGAAMATGAACTGAAETTWVTCSSFCLMVTLKSFC